jgi:hypothetical protein
MEQKQKHICYFLWDAQQQHTAFIWWRRRFCPQRVPISASAVQLFVLLLWRLLTCGCGIKN